MRYLLDTNCLIWVMHGEFARIPKDILHILKTDDKRFSISILSIWEMTIKKSLGKLRLDDSYLEVITKLGLDIIPINIEHLVTLQNLPQHHKDPFDRLIIAQAISEKLTLVTTDQELARYDAKIILA